MERESHFPEPCRLLRKVLMGLKANVHVQKRRVRVGLGGRSALYVQPDRPGFSAVGWGCSLWPRKHCFGLRGRNMCDIYKGSVCAQGVFLRPHMRAPIPRPAVTEPAQRQGDPAAGPALVLESRACHGASEAGKAGWAGRETSQGGRVWLGLPGERCEPPEVGPSG